MTHEPTSMSAQCVLVVSALSEEQGWNLSTEQQQAYVQDLTPHLPHAHSLRCLKTMVMYYHREHTLVQAMRNCADPRHDMIWQQQIQKVIGILHRQGFAWSKDAAIDIDDLAQIALLELVHALPTYHYTSCFSTWAYAVIVRRMKRHLRDRSALKRSGNAVSLNTNCETTVPVATAEQPETIAEGHIFADLIYEVLARQQGMQVAEIFQMWANDDIKLAHIGEHVQCSASWTRALLNKARTSLQQHPGIQAWLQQSGSSEQSP